MIVFVTGPIGSGKTYAAGRLAEQLGSGIVSLDEVFFDLKSPVHRKRRDESERASVLLQHLTHSHVVFEGWHFGDWLIPMYKKLDLLVVVDTPLAVREDRIRRRFENRKAGLEADPFPLGDEGHLQNLLKWTQLFDLEKTLAEITAHAPAECRIVYSNSDLDGLDMEDCVRTRELSS